MRANLFRTTYIVPAARFPTTSTIECVIRFVPIISTSKALNLLSRPFKHQFERLTKPKSLNVRKISVQTSA